MTPHVGAAGGREKQPGAPSPRPRRNPEAPRPPSVLPAAARALKATRSGPRGPGRRRPPRRGCSGKRGGSRRRSRSAADFRTFGGVPRPDGCCLLSFLPRLKRPSQGQAGREGLSLSFQPAQRRPDAGSARPILQRENRGGGGEETGQGHPARPRFPPP